MAEFLQKGPILQKFTFLNLLWHGEYKNFLTEMCTEICCSCNSMTTLSLNHRRAGLFLPSCRILCQTGRKFSSRVGNTVTGIDSAGCLWPQLWRSGCRCGRNFFTFFYFFPFFTIQPSLPPGKLHRFRNPRRGQLVPSAKMHYSTKLFWLFAFVFFFIYD